MGPPANRDSGIEGFRDPILNNSKTGRKLVEKWHAYYASPTRLTVRWLIRLLLLLLISLLYQSPTCTVAHIKYLLRSRFVLSEFAQFVLEANAR